MIVGALLARITLGATVEVGPAQRLQPGAVELDRPA
jgi:hypothetical protein